MAVSWRASVPVPGSGVALAAGRTAALWATGAGFTTGAAEAAVQLTAVHAKIAAARIVLML